MDARLLNRDLAEDTGADLAVKPKTTTVMACAGLLAAVPTGPRGSPVSVVSSYGMKSKTKPQPREAKAGFEVVAHGTVPPLRPAEVKPPTATTAAPDDDDDGPAAKRARIQNDGRWSLAAVTFEVFPDRFATLPAARKSVRLGEVRVDGTIRRPDYRPMPGEDIAIVTRISSGKTLDIKDLPPSLSPLIVKHEDPHFAVVVKPEGLNTVGDGAGGWTAERMLPYFLRPTAGVEGALVRPRPVHRLDARTGGLLVVAKTRLAMTSLSEAFASRKVSKRYRAVLCGEPKFDGQATIEVDDAAEIGTRLTLGVEVGTRLTLGVIDAPMEKKECVSHWRVVSHVPCERYGRLTLVDMWPKTGRTHQLRKHASGALGCPILGDGRYTARHSLDDTEGLFLWSMEVALPPSATPWRFGDGETAADDDDRKWLRVKVDSDPEKFRARVGM